jgi:hypothetical protein
MIPVWVDPVYTTTVVGYLFVAPLDELGDRACPVCDDPLGEGTHALVYVGRRPWHTRSVPEYHKGPWAAAAVPVHVGCTDANEEGEDVPAA